MNFETEKKFKHVAIMDVHNVTGDFTTCFGALAPGEVAMNPSAADIIFFRWWKAKALPNETRECAQLRYFKALHETIKLDAVVVFGDTEFTSLEDGIAIAAGTRQIDPNIKIFLNTNCVERELPVYTTAGITVDKVCNSDTFSRNDPVLLLTTMLKIKTRWQEDFYGGAGVDGRALVGVADNYKDRFPKIDKPETFAAHVPVVPVSRDAKAYLASFNR